MSHTPEPWIFDSKHSRIKTIDGKHIAIVLFGDIQSYIEEDANGKLMASAPDLYVELERLVGFINTYIPGHVPQRLLNECEAAIKKVKSEQ